MMQVSEMGMVKQRPDRIRALRMWHQEGGVMIIGYEAYRILSTAKGISDGGLQKELKSILVDPGTAFIAMDVSEILVLCVTA